MLYWQDVHEETREELILIEFRSFFVLYNLKNKETTKHFYPSFHLVDVLNLSKKHKISNAMVD